MGNIVWRDVNLPGAVGSKGAAEPEKKFVTGVEPDNSQADEPPPSEFRLIEATWVEGPEGFVYNKTCYVDATVEKLRETIRSKFSANLFGTYDGVEEDLNQVVTGYHDEKCGKVRLTISKLWFVNNAHYSAWQKDASVLMAVQ